MDPGKPGVVVKNTFLEVGDHMPALSEWRRQMSEPVKIYTSPNDEEVEEDDAEVPEEMPPLPFAMTPPSTSSTHPGHPGHPVPGQMPTMMPGAMPPGALGAAPCFEAAPQPMMPRQGVREQGRRDIRNGQAINQLKNNDITSKEPPWNDVTTVMMRNLPNKYRQQMLLDELADAGFRAQTDFDFFYLPMDHSNAANLGYCFINFTEPALANAFAAAFQGKKMRRFNSHKTVVVMPASIQGYERNYKYYSSTRVAQAEDPAYRPLFLKNMDFDMSQDRKSSGRGKGFDKGGKGGKKGSKEKGGPKGAHDGKGVEAFSRLAFMGLDDGNAQQGDWAPMPEQMAWQQQPAMQAPFAAPCGGGGGGGGRSGATVTCPNCGNICSADHRFCSACGHPAGTLPGHRQPHLTLESLELLAQVPKGGGGGAKNGWGWVRYCTSEVFALLCGTAPLPEGSTNATMPTMPRAAPTAGPGHDFMQCAPCRALARKEIFRHSVQTGSTPCFTLEPCVRCQLNTAVSKAMARVLNLSSRLSNLWNSCDDAMALAE
ncbi:ML4 [Symbiodinium pilosum]|uniref:ML4 protein n=1 Tax=Symbiodinium pilosum TaxID=2952 RepID=A0A812XU37_SYMPI|nr:ML4 [Symbiodinium pilosum]